MYVLCKLLICLLPVQLEGALSELWFVVEQQPTPVQHRKDNLDPECTLYVSKPIAAMQVNYMPCKKTCRPETPPPPRTPPP